MKTMVEYQRMSNQWRKATEIQGHHVVGHVPRVMVRDLLHDYEAFIEDLLHDFNAERRRYLDQSGWAEE